MALFCNDVSHWLGANLEPALCQSSFVPQLYQCIFIPWIHWDAEGASIFISIPTLPHPHPLSSKGQLLKIGLLVQGATKSRSKSAQKILLTHISYLASSRFSMQSLKHLSQSNALMGASSNIQINYQMITWFIIKHEIWNIYMYSFICIIQVLK